MYIIYLGSGLRGHCVDQEDLKWLLSRTRPIAETDVLSPLFWLLDLSHLMTRESCSSMLGEKAG